MKRNFWIYWWIKSYSYVWISILIGGLLNHLSYAWVFNNPWPLSDANQRIFYSSFSEQPKTLDPAKSYSSNEYQFIAQIYEPPLEYDYFARPYQLVPLTAASMPTVTYFNKNNYPVAADDSHIAYSVYTITIKPGVLFQPHPALAKNSQGKYCYLHLADDYLERHAISTLFDFIHNGTRAVNADDYIYQIKRLANPAVSSPIYGLMSEHILGFQEFAQQLPIVTETNQWVDLRQYPMRGLKKNSDDTFEIILKGHYPQFMFWLAMPFFAPVPWEADQFYAQTGMDNKNLRFDWYPVGTGPFMLGENNPNRSMQLDKNPNFRQVFFPSSNNPNDINAGLTRHSGLRLPLIDKAIYVLEKESIPRWSKFLQGYYDTSAISTDSFDQAIQMGPNGKPELGPLMRAKHMRLNKTIDTSIYYLGFNMLDPVIGGMSEQSVKLRQAISIAVNYDENISIFLNGRGHAAQGPLPPNIFGYREGLLGINPYVYRGVGVRRPLADAQLLMKEAGLADGIDPSTGQALMLHYDVSVTGTPDDKSQLDWMRKQFARIGINLDIRATQYNRFQDKMRNGNAQIFSWGWNADYPDPENFLFMLYGANAKVKYGGENAANYQNPVYDDLFDQMKHRDNDAKRQQLIDQMIEIVRHDAPWVWGINTESLLLSQQWVSPIKPNTISLNQLKYMAIDVAARNKWRVLWNQPVLWPLCLLAIVLMIVGLCVFQAFRLREKQTAPRQYL